MFISHKNLNSCIGVVSLITIKLYRPIKIYVYFVNSIKTKEIKENKNIVSNRLLHCKNMVAKS